MKYGPDGEVCSITLIYVDDFIGTHRSDYNIKEVYDLFRWGQLGTLDHCKDHNFKGKQLQLFKDKNGRYKLRIFMSKFREALESGRVRRGRLQQDPELQPHERAELKSVGGCLQWVAGQARPEIAATVNSWRT